MGLTKCHQIYKVSHIITKVLHYTVNLLYLVHHDSLKMISKSNGAVIEMEPI